MKKLVIFLLFLFACVTPVMAATIVSEYNVTLDQYEVKSLAPVIITSTSDGDITAEYGIHILLDMTDKILFNEQDLNFIGSAIDNGRVNLNVQAVFSDDYKSLFIPVIEDFEAGDWIQASGLAIRAYDDTFGSDHLGLDLNGDLIAEVIDSSRYRVSDDERNDITAPYLITMLTYSVNDNGSVVFSWKKPPDYDYYRTIVNRIRIKNGFAMTSTVYNDTDGLFTDSDLEDVSFASYSFIASDSSGNWSDPVVVNIDFTPPIEEEVIIPVEEPPVVEEPVEKPVESELSELSRLQNYYNIRYSIKCMPGGVEVAENDSACLWARIDLVYSQEITGEELVDGLALFERDLELMATRRKWPEMRYEDNCVESSEPASYCPALGKALSRVSYFLD